MRLAIKREILLSLIAANFSLSSPLSSVSKSSWWLWLIALIISKVWGACLVAFSSYLKWVSLVWVTSNPLASEWYDMATLPKFRRSLIALTDIQKSDRNLIQPRFKKQLGIPDTSENPYNLLHQKNTRHSFPQVDWAANCGRNVLPNRDCW
mgnify:CR=1 FL=1